MLMKDVVVGERYLALRYASRGLTIYPIGDSRMDGRTWERLAEDAMCVEVLEVGVKHRHYVKPGVLVRVIDPQTGERRVWKNPLREAPDETLKPAQLLVTWDEWGHRYAEHLDEEEQGAERRRREREAEQARRQEAEARRWMQDVHARAREDIEQVMEVVGSSLPESAMDHHVRALVELRHPDGNPYLNGTRKA